MTERAQDPYIRRHPDWSCVAELWLSTYFKNKICVIFFRPLEHLQLIRKHFSSADYCAAIHSEFSIVEFEDIGAATQVCNDTPKVCFTMVWDGKSFVHENT